MSPSRTPEHKREWYRRNPDLVRGQIQRRLAKRRADPELRAKYNEYQRTWRAKNPERAAGHARKSRLRVLYSLTPDEYQALLEQQDGKCAICRSPRLLHIDHSHDDGKVRGLLCFGCNSGLGMFGEDVERMLVAIEYLRRDK